MSLPEYFPNRMRSPDLHVERNKLAIFEALAFSHGDHFAFLGLLFGANPEYRGRPAYVSFLLNPLHHNAVIERSNIHNV